MIMGCYIDPLDVCFGGQLAGFVTLGFMDRGWHMLSS